MKTRYCSMALVSLLSMAASPICLADDYRLELQGTYSHLDAPAAGSDADGFWIQGRWFFNPVNTDGVPLAEAAFLGRASFVSAVAARFESELGNRNYHSSSQAASVGYYIPDTMFFAGVNVSRSEYPTFVSSTTILTDHDTSWGGVLGIAPLDGLLVTTQFNEDGYDPNITARYVGKLPNSHFYAGSVSVIDPDFGDTTFGVDFDYYFDDTFSAGVAYQDSSESVTGKLRKFFSPRFSLGGSYTNGEFSDSFNVDVAWRF